MEEKKFPIYSFSAVWSQDGEHDPNYPNQHKDLPEGRVWNSTGFTKMFKEEQTQEQLDAFVNDWWNRYIEAKGKEENNRCPIINPTIEKLTAKYKHHETWVLTWFSHETFDLGQTDAEALESFENYVRRIEDHNHGKDEFDKDFICLMGAEDRWRWRGSGDDGKPGNETPPPCRCKHCKAQGLIRIGH